MESSTFSGNMALNAGGGGAIYNTGQTTMASTIVADSKGPGGDCYGFGAEASLIDDGYNIADDASCDLTASTSINASPAIDAYLGPLGANGGPTPTVPLLNNSSVDRWHVCSRRILKSTADLRRPVLRDKPRHLQLEHLPGGTRSGVEQLGQLRIPLQRTEQPRQRWPWN